MTRLLIVSHTPHYRRQGQIVGWGPTVRELDQLAQLFTQVTHVAPLYAGAAPASALPYQAAHLRLRPVPPAGGERLGDKVGIARALPGYLGAIYTAMGQADVMHVRCPANISLAALALLALSRRAPRRWIKYAGNWQPDGQEAWSYRLQRGWLRRGLPGSVVTVNGRWPQQPPWVHSFHNPSLTAQELEAGRLAAARKRLTQPVRLLFVGRIEAAKGVGVALRAAQELAQRGLALQFDLVGDGPERTRFAQWAQAHGLQAQVCFHGWRPPAEVAEFYARAHFCLLPSRSEGWPKVLSEAMAYGVVPLAGRVGSIPQILAETGAGAALPPAEPAAYANAILEFVAEPARWRAASQAGVAAAPRFGYGAYLQAVQRLFAQSWRLTLPDHAPQPAARPAP